MAALLTGKEAKEADQYTIREIGIESAVLMERAAASVADRVMRSFSAVKKTRVLSVCGYGNNGGDGIAAARLLLLKGYRAEVFLFGNAGHITPECRNQLKIFEKIGGNVIDGTNCDFSQYDVLIDAVAGIGLKGDLRGDAAHVTEKMNRSGAYIIAVDIPSGVNADNGYAGDAAVRADETVTFSYYKRGHFIYPGREYCGKLILADAGIMLPQDFNTLCSTLMPQEAGSLLPKRYPRSNKGTYGKALLVCGQKNMAGAALLSVRAALRSGAGLVMGISDGENREILQSGVPEALYAEGHSAQADERIAHWADAIGCGCGLGAKESGRSALRKVLASDTEKIILDADALNLIAQEGSFPEHEGKKLIITPHPGEMSRLCGRTIKEILNDPVGIAAAYAKRWNVILVLKDAATVITDGERTCINQTGCCGMSTGGSGDVLTGLLTGLCAQGLDAFDAAVLAVYLHGDAGMAAQEKLGPYAMSAMDIADALPGAFRRAAGEE